MDYNQLTVRLPAGIDIPRLGLGTWRMGEHAASRDAEIAALRRGLDAGIRLIDTAEMYGEGGAEKIIAQALSGRRDQVFLVSKVYPHNASRRGTVDACERSLRRLATDRIDLYLLHWRGEHPLAETVEAFESLVASGKIRYWGVSNLDLEDMTELVRVHGGERCQVNQLYYNLAHRGIENVVLPWQRERGIATMAYSPIDQGRLIKHPQLVRIARSAGTTPARLALAWLLRQSDVITIPKATRTAHLDDCLGAMEATLDAATLAALDAAFPMPHSRGPLEMT